MEGDAVHERADDRSLKSTPAAWTPWRRRSRWRNEPEPQPTSSTGGRRGQRAVARDESFLVGVELGHGSIEQRREHAPVAALAMGDVAVVVEVADAREREPRVLVGEAAARDR